MFLTKDEDIIKNLRRAIKNYEITKINFSQYRVKERKGPSVFYENTSGEKPTIKESSIKDLEGILLSLGNFTLFVSENDFEGGWRIDYTNEKNQVVYDKYPELGKPENTLMRAIHGKMLLEIFFKGKIELEKDKKRRRIKK